MFTNLNSARPGALYSEVILSAIANPLPYLSHSTLSELMECELRVALVKRGFSEPEVPAVWNVGGTVVHKLLQESAASWEFEDAFQSELEATSKASGIPVENFRVANRGKEGVDWWSVEGPGFVDNGKALLEARMNDGWLVAARELDITVPVYADNREVRLRIIADLLLVRGDADSYEYLVVDYKSGGSKPHSPIQLLMYLRALGGRTLRARGEYWMLRKGEVLGFTPDSQWWDVFEANLASKAHATTNDWMPSASPGHQCYRCQAKSVCPATYWVDQEISDE